MLKNVGRYVETIIHADKLIGDFDNDFTFTGQSAGKHGVNITVQVNKDNSEPIIDKKTGLVKDDNFLAVFPVTIVDAKYPLPFKKGDHVSLYDFKPEMSYFIDYNLILRFGDIRLKDLANVTDKK